MVTVKKTRRRELKTSFLGITVGLAIFVFALFLMILGVDSALFYVLLGSFVVGPLISQAVWGTPVLRVEHNGKVCEIFAHDGLRKVAIIEDGYTSREILIEEPTETTVCGLRVRFYHKPHWLGAVLIVEIEGKKYRLP